MFNDEIRFETYRFIFSPLIRQTYWYVWIYNTYFDEYIPHICIWTASGPKIEQQEIRQHSHGDMSPKTSSLCCLAHVRINEHPVDLFCIIRLSINICMSIVCFCVCNCNQMPFRALALLATIWDYYHYHYYSSVCVCFSVDFASKYNKHKCALFASHIYNIFVEKYIHTMHIKCIKLHFNALRIANNGPLTGSYRFFFNLVQAVRVPKIRSDPNGQKKNICWWLNTLIISNIIFCLEF